MYGLRSKLVVLITTAAAAGLLASGCGSGSTQSQSTQSESGSDQSTSINQRSSGGSSSSSQSSTSESGSDQSTSINQSSSDGSSSSSQSSTGGGGLSSFSGDGRTALSFNVEKPSRLAWTNSEGKPFSVKGGGISIHSNTGHGEIKLQPGDYNNVHVEGATWTIVVRPR